MCGFCGILNYGNERITFDESLLTRMSDTVRHRGPDDAGTFISPNRKVGFGFRRLSIVDLSPAGHQPMSSPDGGVTIVFNGEIYNHFVLRKILEAKGHRYRSHSDTESIIYAYQEYGINFVHKLLGMFSIVIWDEGKQQLVVVRDRIGIKPFYYTFAKGNFIFGSEIKAILQYPDVARELNIEALEHYLTFLIPPAPMTLFQGIYKLEAGHRMIIQADGTMKKEQYWDPVPFGVQPSIDFNGEPVERSSLLDKKYWSVEETCIKTIRTLLKQSIKDRMMSDVPFGVFLSGGIDSSTNVALMAELMDRPVDTFSVGFRDLEKYNELRYAQQIAREFKTNHHEIIIDQKDAFDFLPKLIFHQDEPLADPVCIPLYFVSKLARDNGTIVIQVGEGSDEQFAGYQSIRRELLFYHTFWQAYQLLPYSMRHIIFGIVAPFFESVGSFLALDYLRKATESNELFWGGAINFTEAHKRRLMTKRRNPEESHTYVHRWHEEILRRDPSADYLKRMIYLEFKQRLPELLLMRVDKVSMATSVEARVPFLDHRMVEYSMAIPQSFKLKNGKTKYILKKAVEEIIPRNIIYRQKQGFAAPISEWLKNEWYTFAHDQILQSPLINEYFRKDTIDALMRQHQQGRGKVGQNLWNLLNLVLWHKYWIEGMEL